MKKLLFTLSVVLIAANVFAQQATDDFIKLDSTTTHTNFSPVWKTAIFNQVVAIADNKNNPIMLISLPANSNHSPVTGVYTVADGKSRVVKKGSQLAKVQYEPGYISVDEGGTLTIRENDDIYWFTADNISVMDSKTKEIHKLSFNLGMFIEKK